MDLKETKRGRKGGKKRTKRGQKGEKSGKRGQWAATISSLFHVCFTFILCTFHSGPLQARFHKNEPKFANLFVKIVAPLATFGVIWSLINPIINFLSLKGIKATNLEELEYIQSGLDYYRNDFAWASDEIYDLVDEFHRKDRLSEETPEEVLRERLRSDVILIAEECPNLKKLDMSLFGEKTYLYSNDDEIWAPFKNGLKRLISMTLIGKILYLSENLLRVSHNLVF